MSIIQSSKKKDQLLFDGFRYRRANKSQVTWRCVRNSCAGRLTVDNKENHMQYNILTDHNHAPNPDELISKQFKTKIEERAEISNEAPRKIIHEALSEIHPDDALAVPNYTIHLNVSVQRLAQKKVELVEPSCRKVEG
ncbi:unnamed protein product [Adineta ricciae]|uniref:FLYWCH-type domain-containing protein n=1 Tax=Adineta ricciae TaxID=249248 RepID=A0A815K5G1_ADIRI|nr:unnamed protein product [Adineta ricciae]